MFGSNRNNSPKSRKRFWSFGRKTEDKQQQVQKESSVSENSPDSSESALVADGHISSATLPKKDSARSLPDADQLLHEERVSQPLACVETSEETEQARDVDVDSPFADTLAGEHAVHGEVSTQKKDIVEQHSETLTFSEDSAAVSIVSDTEKLPAESAKDYAAAVLPKNASDSVSEEMQEKGQGFFARMRSGLTKTRQSFIGGVATLLVGKKEIDDELLEDLEMQLITADIGVKATTDIIESLTQKMRRKELSDIEALMFSLKQQLISIIEPCSQPLVIDCSQKPYVILVVGVNGVGKTTTIGKLANQLKREGNKVMLAAGDTFRAAAVEQLQEWGSRNEVPVIAQEGHSVDSASVIYDAYEAAKARQYDVLIVDTAGRLHNKDHLMSELKKVKRVLGRLDEASPHEVMLVVDAGTGQNTISQATLFNETVQLTGMTLTKLDGTAKGGIVFALAKTMQLPIRFLGVGEQIDDLRPFSAGEFVDALFAGTQFSEERMEKANS